MGAVLSTEGGATGAAGALVPAAVVTRELKPGLDPATPPLRPVEVRGAAEPPRTPRGATLSAALPQMEGGRIKAGGSVLVQQTDQGHGTS